MMKIFEYLHRHYSKSTAKAYQREINIFLNNNQAAADYNYANIIEYIGLLRSKYNNSRTIKRIVAAIKVYYDYLAQTNQRKDNPTKAIKLRDKISRDVQLQDLFTKEELEKLLNSKEERYKALEKRNKVLISLLIYQALQPQEIANISVKDVNLTAATIYIKQTSTTNRRTLHLKANQILLFQSYTSSLNPSLQGGTLNTPFMQGLRGTAMSAEDITKHVKRSYGNLYAPRKLNCQTIRQSVITNHLKRNKDVRVVQVFAGHKWASSTERYSQQKEDELQEQINKYHPYKQQ